MNSVVPAVLPKSENDLTETLGRLARFAEYVQIDIIDGEFAGPASWPYAESADALHTFAAQGNSLPYWGKLKFDIDLMVERPEESIDDWMTLGATRITVHAESTRFLARLIDGFDKRYGHAPGFSTGLVEFGLAIGLSTDVALIEPYLNRVDYVQFMGIARIGTQGQPFDRRVIERVRAFRRRHPDIDIQVDGGVSKATAPALLKAGAHRFVVGSDLVRAENAKAEYEALEELTEEYGIYE